MRQNQIRVINFILFALLAFIALLFVVQSSAQTMPVSPDEVIGRMLQADAQRFGATVRRTANATPRWWFGWCAITTALSSSL